MINGESWAEFSLASRADNAGRRQDGSVFMLAMVGF